MMQTYGARIVWLGRRPLDNTIQARLDALQGDPAPVYIQADAGNLHSLEKARQQIKQRFGRIDGLVHSAISLLDQSLNNMNEERFRAGLSAKADVCVRLAEVFGRDDPDLVLFFSSMQSFGKMAGQSNYAAGCVFKDAFARQLARAWGAKGGGPVVKIMNWGYWGSVGVVTDAAYRDRMEQAGVGSIEPAEGMAALDVLLQGPMDQLGLVKMVEAHRKPTHTEPAMEQK